MCHKSLFETAIKILLSSVGVAAALCCAGCSANLFSASCEGDVEAVSKLLVNGAPVNKDRDLWCASFHGNNEIVGLLLSKNADPNKLFPDHENNIPLLAAVSSGSQATVELLLKHGAKVNLHDSDGNTALSLAAIHNNEAIIKLLIANGAHIDEALKALDSFGECTTYSHLLAQNGKAVLEKHRNFAAEVKLKKQ